MIHWRDDRIGRPRARRRAYRFAAFVAMACLLVVTAAGAEPIALDIHDVHVDRDRTTGVAIVSIRLAESSKRAFGRFTLDNVGHRIELRIDGKAIVASVLREPILGGVMEISDVPDADAVVEQVSKGEGQGGGGAAA
jgi:preprotein translocase subunit SecD